ncbi:MAG TPA: hypothetical protein VH222_11615 [Phenylobacterium sp.]|jgi:hypothetical protein|nr:hypothetical protein [Phenylobacterium sp.]
MLGRGLAVALSALAMVVGGCGVDARADAANGIATFLDAVRRGDQPAFEAALDRPALRSDLRDQLTALGRANGVDVNGGPSDFALDRMITPEAFRLVEAHTGQALPMAPTAAQVALSMALRDPNHACVQDLGKARCLLSFAKQNGVWRLVGMPATDLKVEMLPEPAKKRP